jgi:hypothetical protein
VRRLGVLLAAVIFATMTWLAWGTPIGPVPEMVLVPRVELEELRFIARLQKHTPNCMRMWVNS